MRLLWTVFWFLGASMLAGMMNSVAVVEGRRSLFWIPQIRIDSFMKLVALLPGLRMELGKDVGNKRL
jgi:hypothetical protein